MPRLGHLIAILVLSAANLVSAQTPKVATEISQALQDRQYEGAIAAIDKALEQGDGPVDYLLYLKARAYHFQQKYDQAIATFEIIELKYQDSPWARRARFARALSQTRIGGFLKAEQTYRQEAEYLLSSERKQEIADVYLEFANHFYEPEDALEKPDHAKALQFFQQALSVGPESAERVAIELKVGRCLQHLGKHQEAIQQYQRFVKEHGDAPEVVEARFQLGQAYLQIGNRAEARRTWQDLIAEHAESDSPRIAEATYRIASTNGVPQPPTQEDLSRGVAVLQHFIKQYPNHKLASRAHLEIARSYQHHRRYEDAAAALRAFLEDDRYARARGDSRGAGSAWSLLPVAEKLRIGTGNMERVFGQASRPQAVEPDPTVDH